MEIIKNNESKIVANYPELKSSNWFLSLLTLLFFLSGISGLIYQVLWMRHMSFIFGVTIYAASAVLASFMAGLALGSYLAGRTVDRLQNPLLWYGVAEILVGISAVLTPVALDWVQQAYVAAFPTLSKGLALLTLARFLFSSMVLIIPTTLMGATLPIIIKSSLLEKEGLGARVSLLYASNTAGAIAGALLAGFYLIGSLGMAVSFRLAAALNIIVGALAIGAAFVWQPKSAAIESSAPVVELTDSTVETISPRAAKIVLWVFGISGLTSLALEVIWFRILILFLEATTYAFTIMLATFLFGIAAGSYLAALLIKRNASWLKWLAVMA
jgi:spermidine synthase